MTLLPNQCVVSCSRTVPTCLIQHWVPIWVSKDLLNLKGDPKSALKFFKEAGARAGFRHAAESYCVLAHILFCGMFYLDARSVIKEWILLGREFPGCDFFDMLWSTRNVCRPGFGVFDTLFSVLVDLGMLEEAKAMLLEEEQVHGSAKSEDMVVAGLSPSVFTYNIVIGCLAREGGIETARSLFEEMKALGLRPDIVTYNPLIYGYGKVGMLTGAVTVFEEMKDAGCEPDVITYNSLINLKEFLKLLSDLNEAFKLESEMQQAGVNLNIVTYTALLDGLCEDGRMREAEELFGALQNKIEDSMAVIREMMDFGLIANSYIYTTLMDAYFKVGKTTEAVNLLQEMQDLGIKITVVTYGALIDGLCKKGLAQQAVSYFDHMTRTGLQPNIMIYTALIDGLCKNDCVEEAKNLFNEMLDKGISPDKLIYTSLIDGNMKHGNPGEAEFAK
ncbi:Putative pentatricopeptide repeat-containing protein [Glycine soja]|nr:Putative pentatricopeptide repeat-containing protein [Glycine soja]